MKSRFYLAILVAGFLPLVGVGGFYFYNAMNPTTAPAKVGGPAPTSGVNLQQLQASSQTIASSISAAVKKVTDDIPTLAAHNKTADLEAFVHSHPGLTGVIILSREGKVARKFGSGIADDSYAKNSEFQKVLDKFKENGNKTYQFYTPRLGYPAFIFATPIGGTYFVETALKLSHFFEGMENQKGEYAILEAGSGKYLYHSNPSKVLTSFNPGSEAWLNQVQADLSAQKSGTASQPNAGAAGYGYLFSKLGVLHIVPMTAGVAVQAPIAKAPEPPELVDLVYTPMGLAFLIALVWLFLAAGTASSIILAPLHRAAQMVHAAADDSSTLTPEIAQSFGSGDIGQMVQAVVYLNERSQDKDASVKHATEQLDTVQQQSRKVQTELQEKTQMLNDKLKELDALKAMGDGLRSQSEQAKEENARLKGQLSEAQEAKGGFEKKLADVQALLKAAESKALQATTATSAVQVSQSRAAAIRTMSEELKNTLGIIKGYVSSMLGVGQGAVNEKQQEFLGMVINRSARLEKFINDLVDVYQVEIEYQDAKTEEIALATEIEGLAFNFQPQTEVKNLKIKVDAKPNLPKVPVVRRRFNQLWNIIYLQVIKDAPKGSTITITVEPMGEAVKVSVVDPGMVVQPESLPRLFDEFYDPKHPASPQLAGTGLKFALVKTILSVFGGGATAEKAEPGTRLVLNFSTKKRAPGSGPALASTPSAAPSPAPAAAKPVTSAPAATPTPSAPPSATPGISLGAKPVAPAPATGGAGMLDALISGKIPPVTAPGVKAPPAPLMPPSSAPTAPPPTPAPAVPPAAPSAPAPAAPPMPGASAAPKPAAPAPPPPPPPSAAPPAGPKMMSPLDALLAQKNTPPPGAPMPGAPGTPKPAAPAPPPIPPPPASGAPKPYIAPGSLDALLGGSNPPPEPPKP